MDSLPVDRMPGGHMPVERPPYEPRTEMIAEPPPAPFVPPPQPVVAQAPQPVAAPEPPPPPPVVPAILADVPPEKPKRGWWRR